MLSKPIMLIISQYVQITLYILNIKSSCCIPQMYAVIYVHYFSIKLKKRRQITSINKEVEKMESLYIAGVNCTYCEMISIIGLLNIHSLIYSKKKSISPCDENS